MMETLIGLFGASALIAYFVKQGRPGSKFSLIRAFNMTPSRIMSPTERAKTYSEYQQPRQGHASDRIKGLNLYSGTVGGTAETVVAKMDEKAAEYKATFGNPFLGV